MYARRGLSVVFGGSVMQGSRVVKGCAPRRKRTGNGLGRIDIIGHQPVNQRIVVDVAMPTQVLFV